MIPVKDTLIVEKAGTLDDWGRPTGSTTETFKARIDYIDKVVKDMNGKDVLSTATILIKGVALVSTNDKVKWSDAYGEHEAYPISVSPIKDLANKILFTKVVI